MKKQNQQLQPTIIDIDSSLRLRKYDGYYSIALPWYENEATLKLVDNRDNKPYSQEKVQKMYTSLQSIGELYFIEVLENGAYKQIGDVTFSKDDMPIIIGDENYRGKGIGYKVIMTLVNRAKELGFERISVKEIYSHNLGSQKTFEKAGFKKHLPTKNGFSYVLDLCE